MTPARLAASALALTLAAGCGSAAAAAPMAATTTSSSPCTSGATGELVEVYVALLRTQEWTTARIFVSAQPADQFAEAGAEPGPIDPVVMRCLGAGVEGLPKVVVVERPDDPALPTAASNGPIRALPDGPLVTFGPLGAQDDTTSITVDAGSGYVHGSEYRVDRVEGGVTVLSTGSAWIS
ncbi:MAG TPA: hypothetical protein VF661_14915 [Actinomycetales bacterium]